jgi:hypothetical protein
LFGLCLKRKYTNEAKNKKILTFKEHRNKFESEKGEGEKNEKEREREKIITRSTG